MPAVSILSLALGLAFLSGINLYLTTFLAGLASRMGWLDAMGLSGSLPLVSHPAAMTHSGVARELREEIGLTDALIRISVGLEHLDDLKADLSRGLDTLA